MKGLDKMYAIMRHHSADSRATQIDSAATKAEALKAMKTEFARETIGQKVNKINKDATMLVATFGKAECSWSIAIFIQKIETN